MTDETILYAFELRAKNLKSGAQLTDAHLETIRGGFGEPGAEVVLVSASEWMPPELNAASQLEETARQTGTIVEYSPAFHACLLRIRSYLTLHPSAYNANLDFKEMFYSANPWSAVFADLAKSMHNMAIVQGDDRAYLVLKAWKQTAG